MISTVEVEAEEKHPEPRGKEADVGDSHAYKIAHGESLL